MTIEEQVEDAVERLFILLNKEPTSEAEEDLQELWYDSIPVIPEILDSVEENKKALIKSLLRWIPESHMNDHTSGFIIQNKTIFDKWYNTLKLNTQNDTTTTNSVT